MSKPIELREWLEVDTPLGRGYAIIFESDNDENFWTVIISEDRAIVTFKQKEIKTSRNYTWGRSFPPDDMKKVISSDLPKMDDPVPISKTME